MRYSIHVKAKIEGSFEDAPGLDTNGIASSRDFSWKNYEIKGLRLLPENLNTNYIEYKNFEQVYCNILSCNHQCFLFVYRFRKFWPIDRYDQKETWFFHPDDILNAALHWTDILAGMPEMKKYKSNHTSYIPEVIDIESSVDALEDKDFFRKLVYRCSKKSALKIHSDSTSEQNFLSRLKGLPPAYRELCCFGLNLSSSDSYAVQFLNVFTCLDGKDEDFNKSQDTQVNPELEGVISFALEKKFDTSARIDTLLSFSEIFTDQESSVPEKSENSALYNLILIHSLYFRILQNSVPLNRQDLSHIHNYLVAYLHLKITPNDQELQFFILAYNTYFSSNEPNFGLFEKIWNCEFSDQLFGMVKESQHHKDILKKWIGVTVATATDLLVPEVPSGLKNQTSLFASAAFNISDDISVSILLINGHLKNMQYKALSLYKEYYPAYSILPKPDVFFSKFDLDSLMACYPDICSSLNFISTYPENLLKQNAKVFEKWLNRFTCPVILKCCNDNFIFKKSLLPLFPYFISRSKEIKIQSPDDLKLRMDWAIEFGDTTDLTSFVIKHWRDLLLHKEIMRFVFQKNELFCIEKISNENLAGAILFFDKDSDSMNFYTCLNALLKRIMTTKSIEKSDINIALNCVSNCINLNPFEPIEPWQNLIKLLSPKLQKSFFHLAQKTKGTYTSSLIAMVESEIPKLKMSSTKPGRKKSLQIISLLAAALALSLFFIFQIFYLNIVAREQIKLRNVIDSLKFENTVLKQQMESYERSIAPLLKADSMKKKSFPDHTVE